MPATFTVEPVSALWSIDREGSKTTGKTVFRVFASEPSTPLAASLATGLPIYGDDYPDATGEGITCRKIHCEADNGDQTRMLWRVECDYDSTAEAFAGSPLDEPAKISSDNQQVEETYFKDETVSDSGPNTAVFTNKRPFKTLPKRFRSVRVLTIERNVEATQTDADYADYDNRINEPPVTINGVTYTEGQLRMCGYSLSEIKTQNNVDYKVLKTQLKVNQDGWNQKYESRGIVDIDGKPKAVTGSSAPSKDPYPLDVDGHFKEMTDTGYEITLRPYKTNDLNFLLS